MSDCWNSKELKKKNTAQRPGEVSCGPDQSRTVGLGADWCLPALFPTIISRYDMLAQPLLKLSSSTVLFKVIGSNDTGYDRALAFNVHVMKTRRGDSL
jgi:hypothetical protein